MVFVTSPWPEQEVHVMHFHNKTTWYGSQNHLTDAILFCFGNIGKGIASTPDNDLTYFNFNFLFL